MNTLSTVSRVNKFLSVRLAVSIYLWYVCVQHKNRQTSDISTSLETAEIKDAISPSMLTLRVSREPAIGYIPLNKYLIMFSLFYSNSVMKFNGSMCFV